MVDTSSRSDAFFQRLLKTEDADERRQLILNHRLSPDEQRDAINRLIDEAERILGIDPVRMERVAKDAMALADSLGSEYWQAMALMRYADALRFQGRNAEAATSFDKAESAFKGLGKPVEAARTRIGWAKVTAALGKTGEALAAVRPARRTLLANGETRRVASLDLTTGSLFFLTGRYREALRHYSRALKLYGSLGTSGRNGIALSHANRGRTLTSLGRYREALTELLRGRDVFLQQGETRNAAELERYIGQHQMSMGRYAGALRSFEAAHSAYRAVGIEAADELVTRDIVDCLMHLGRPVDALHALDEARGLADNVHYLADLETRRLTAFIQLGQSNLALEELDRAEKEHPVADIQHNAWLSHQRASILLDRNLPEQAIASARKAQCIAKSGGMRSLFADSLICEGKGLLALGEIPEASKVASRVLRIARGLDASPVLYRALELNGLVAESRGRSRSARRHYKEALHQLEREQAGVIFEFRDTFAGRRTTAFERLAALQIQAGQFREALQTVEQAKSRALVDAVTGNVEIRPRGSVIAHRLARELTDVREEYAAASRHASLSGGPSPEAEIRLSQLEGRMTSLVHRLQIAGVGDDVAELYGVALPPQVKPPPEDTILVEFFCSGDDLVRFVVAGDETSAHVLTGALPEVERLMRAFRLNLNAAENSQANSQDLRAGQVQTILQRLYQLLFEGIDTFADFQALVVVPHGLLHYLPFHALHDGQRYLIERLAVNYAPSATVYDICRARRTRPRGKALVMANSAGGQLAFAIREAAEIGEILHAAAYTEGQATRETLEARGRKASVIHIAAHAAFRADAPLFSAIELADGPLTTADIFGLSLEADLVTLSACETARGVIGGGDEVIGMTRAFLYAGTRSLLVSQWRVEDSSTAQLMSSFYQHRQKGLSNARALQAAQLSFLSPQMPQSGRSHPFFWAGFQIIGAA